MCGPFALGMALSKLPPIFRPFCSPKRLLENRSTAGDDDATKALEQDLVVVGSRSMANQTAKTAAGSTMIVFPSS